jgi:toxin HigB-1
MYSCGEYTLRVLRRVGITSRARKDLRRIPRHVASKFKMWVEAVENDGLEVVRRTPGFHDEPLHGKRVGERSFRLNRQYRAIYRILTDGTVEFVGVREVTPHGYKDQ